MSTAVRVISMIVEGEKYIGFEIPQDLIRELNLKDGEILDAEITDDNALIFTRTGIITNDDR